MLRVYFLTDDVTGGDEEITTPYFVRHMELLNNHLLNADLEPGSQVVVNQDMTNYSLRCYETNQFTESEIEALVTSDDFIFNHTTTECYTLSEGLPDIYLDLSATVAKQDKTLQEYYDENKEMLGYHYMDSDSLVVYHRRETEYNFAVTVDDDYLTNNGVAAQYVMSVDCAVYKLHAINTAGAIHDLKIYKEGSLDDTHSLVADDTNKTIEKVNRFFEAGDILAMQHSGTLPTNEAVTLTVCPARQVV